MQLGGTFTFSGNHGNTSSPTGTLSPQIRISFRQPSYATLLIFQNFHLPHFHLSRPSITKTTYHTSIFPTFNFTPNFFFTPPHPVTTQKFTFSLSTPITFPKAIFYPLEPFLYSILFIPISPSRPFTLKLRTQPSQNHTQNIPPHPSQPLTTLIHIFQLIFNQKITFFQFAQFFSLL